MITRYTVRENAHGMVITECERYLSAQAARTIADTLWREGDYQDAAYYDAMVRNGERWDNCWSEYDVVHAVPLATVSKLARRGQWRATRPGRAYRYLVCEY